MSYTFAEVVKSATEYFGGDRMAAEIWANKYALQSKPGAYEELTPTDTHKRLAKEFARIEEKFGGPNKLTEAQIFECLDRFERIVPQGSPMSAIGNTYNLMSSSNCFVVDSPKDDLASIMRTATRIALIEKRRGGVGVDLSNLRPTGAAVNNAAQKSTGIPSFSDFYSFVTRLIGQSGRQGALMVTLNVMHPDSPLFATMKLDKTKVTGANVSLRITDEFMKAVRDGKEVELRWPLEGTPKITRKVNAAELFDIIVNSAYTSGEPGLLMWDTVTRNLPAHCYKQFKTISTNPCSELALSAHDSCRLISMNLTGYVEQPFTAQAKFNAEKFAKDVAAAMRLCDDLVELELELILKIRNSCTDKLEKKLWHNIYEAARIGRRTGLGTHGFGDVLARLGIKYDSDRAHYVARLVYGTLRDVAYSTSIEMAKERGAFPAWEWKREKDCEFFSRMPAALIKEMSKCGRRNISILTQAPTGSISMLSQTSSGIEPIFRLEYTRRTKIHGNQGLSIDFTDANGDKWHHYQARHRCFVEYCAASGIKLDTKKTLKDQGIAIPEQFATSDQLDYRKNVKLIGLVQSFIDHGLSCTVNMPKDATQEMVKQVYIDAWKVGMKGVTVYVEGSRDGVLIVNEEGKAIKHNLAPKRPQDIPCDIHMTLCNGKRWLVIVGLLEGEPYEVLAGRASDLPMPREITKAITRKMGKRQYSIVYTEDGEEVFVPIKESFLEPNGMLVRLLTNQCLRHGVPLEAIYDTITKASDINDFSRTVIRVLKKYVPEGATWGLKCKKCNSKNVRLIDGCPTCQESGCGFSRCS